MLTQKKIDQLLKSGNWMIRFDKNGQSHNGFFKWEVKGRWTHAPDWDDKPECGNGLHGQNSSGYGFCTPGTRLVLCQTKGKQVVIDKDKVKVEWAKIIAVDEEIPPVFLTYCSLYLEGYQHPLPEGLTSVGGYLDLRGYQHPLPEGLTSVGGSLYLRGYQHPLPEGLTSVGGYLYLRGYQHPLPEGLTSVGGSLYLEGYQHPLPEGLTRKER